MTSKVHRVRFYNPKPKPINCLSFNRKSKHVAIARVDASIEIWDLNCAPYLVRFIPGVEDGSVEALGWVQERLLSTGLGGALVEWDLDKLCIKTSSLLTGYAAWCLDVNAVSTLVAVGTEQGYINLYSIENNDIVYNKLFDKQDGRIVCCKFDNTGNILVTGSIDSIRVWNVETGHAITRISVSRRKKEVIVWRVAILSNNTIVSGDSHGRLTFWDATLGEQIESYPTHKADILSIAVSEDEKNIYCSGMDPTIAHFVKVNQASEKTGAQWVKNIQRHIHEHDVRDLVIDGEILVSVGVDGYLTFSRYPPKWVMRIPPMVPNPRSSVSRSKKLLLLRYSNYLEVWKLGTYATNESGDVMISNLSIKPNDTQAQKKTQIEQDSTTFSNCLDNNKEKQNLKLKEHPLMIASVQTKKGKQIQCCELSPSGEFIVYTTDSDVRMLKLETDYSEEDQTNISLSKVMINGLSVPCDRVAFAEDSRTMVAHCYKELRVLHVDPEAGATVVQTISLEKYLKSASILHLVVSRPTPSGATYVVVADTSGAIEVLVDKKKRFSHHATLPNYQCVPSAVTVDYRREMLVVVYVDQTVVEYDLVNKKFTPWPGELGEAWRARCGAVVDVTLHPARDALLFRDDTALWVLERNRLVDRDQPEAKRKPHSGRSLELNVIPIKYCVGFHWVGADEAVLLQVPPQRIVAQLPAPAHTNHWHIRP